MRPILPLQPCPRPRTLITRRLPLLVALALVAGLPTVRDAGAQAVVGEPTDLSFTVRDATSGQPATPERVTLDYVAGRMNNILDTRPAEAAFTVQAIPVKDIGQYIVTVWYQGVPYWWQKRGSDLMAGPVALDVFSVSDQRDAVKITGLNVIVRHRETMADLEWMVEIGNQTSPQATVSLAGGTFALELPSGVIDLDATYLRGPAPTPVPVSLLGTHATVAMPLTPGANRLRLTARLPWDATFELPVGSDLAIEAWSLLTAPPSVTVEATGLQTADEQSVPGFVRRAGSAIGAGQLVALRLTDGAAGGTPEQLFETETTASDAGAGPNAGKPEKDGRGFPLPLAALLVLVIIGALVIARRGRS